jgi:hypothetical protein
MLGGVATVTADSALSDANECQRSENHTFLHNYNDTDTVATCGAAGPVVAGLAIAATGVSTVTAANDIVEITTGVSPLKEGVVALGGSEDIYNGIRTGLDVATMLIPGGGGKAALVGDTLGLAASHADDAVRVARTAGTHADDAARAVGGGAQKTVQPTPYAHLQDPPSVGAGKEFSATQKNTIIEDNLSRNNGVVRSDLSGNILVKPQQSQRGVTPSPNEWQIDRIEPKSQGGSNSYSNAQVLSRKKTEISGINE